MPERVMMMTSQESPFINDDGMTWRRFSYYWPFVREIHWLPAVSPHKKLMKKGRPSYDVTTTQREGNYEPEL